jgi:tRNA pseudouridine55 synthase
VTAQSIEVVAADQSSLSLELSVSKGYYVRALARDLGASLGVPAHLGALRRLASGPFDIEEACPWPPEARPEVMPIAAAARRSLPKLTLTPGGERRARAGQPLTQKDFLEDAGATYSAAAGGFVAWLSGEDRRLVAIGRQSDAEQFRVVRGFQS